MSTENSQPASVLRKKLRPPAPTRAPYHKALEDHADEVFRKTAKKGFSLDVLVPEATAERKSTEKALEELPEISVLLLLESPEGEVGLCVIDGALNDGLIEQQMLGRIAKAPRGERAVTEIDAALCEGFVRQILAQFDADLEHLSQADSVRGYLCDKPQFDRAELRLLLTALQMDVLRVVVDLGPGVKTGTIEFWFPATGGVISEHGVVSNPVGPKLRPYVLDATVPVMAMLDPVPISLGKMMNLAVGDLVEIPREALVRARIMDQRGVLVTRAQLGQLNSMRAARIIGLRPANIVADPERQRMDDEMLPGSFGDMGVDLGGEMGGDPGGVDLPVPAGDLGFDGGELPDIGAGRDGPAADDFPAMDMPAVDMSELEIGGDGAEDDEMGFPMAAAPIDLD